MRGVKLIAGALCALLAHGLIAADTWYVDNTLGKLDANGNETYDGKSATVADGHGPCFKIQNAVDRAAVGDTVKIAAGVYGDEQGYMARDTTFNAMRVKISKSITLEGAGREKTIIRGAFDTVKGAEKGYCGANSVGGIVLTAAASAAKIKSLTVCDCSHSLTSGLKAGNYGTAIGYNGTASKSMADKPWIVDCVVSNVFHCKVPLYNVNLARSLVAHTYGVSHTDASVNADRGAGSYLNAIHSAFCYLGDVPRGVSTNHYRTASSTPLVLSDSGSIVNCVFSHNMNAVSPTGISVDAILNCVETEHDANTAIRATAINYCVLHATSGYVATTDAQVGDLYGRSAILAAPLFLDFHPVAPTTTVAPETYACAVTNGLASCLDAFPEEYRWTDYYGESFSADANGRICAGCSQKPIVPACAFMTSKDVVVDGFPSYCEHRNYGMPSWIYLASNDWPRVFELDWDRAANSDKTDVFEYEVGDGSMVKVPNMSGKALFVPRRGVRNARVVATFPSATYYVNVATGSDSAAGTSAAPLKSIQAAVDKASSAYGVRTLVKVAPGDYAPTGLFKNNDAYVCVGVGSGKQNALIGIRSTAGAETTRIVGSAAPREYADEYGFGTNAARCVAFFGTCSNSFIQGFTLMNGHCARTNDETSAAVYTSKAVGSYPFVTVADCIITNCYGSRSTGSSNRGGILRGVRAVRCKIVDNRNYGNGMIRNCHLVNSLVDGAFDLLSVFNNVLIDCPIQGCTLVGRNTESMLLPSNHYNLFDTIVSDTRKFGSNGDGLYAGVVFGNGAGDNDNTRYPEGICRKTVAGDPGFANAAAANYRLVTDSPAIGWGVWAALPGYDTAPLVSDTTRSVSSDNARNRYYDNITYDLDGLRPVTEKGQGVAGCYQHPAAVRVSVSELPSDVTVAGLPAGSVLPFGATTRVSITSSVRPITSVTVNGKAVDPAGFDLVAPAYDPDAADWRGLAFDIVVAPSVWYVDAVNGNDENNGWTEGTAFRTLKRALGSDSHVVSGETVLALPGTYTYTDGSENCAMTPPKGTLPTVAVVPEGVKLVSRDGAKATVIEGHVDDTFWVDPDPVTARGEGPDNVRCVYLQTNAVVNGFTIRHGGPFKTAAEDADKLSGGVYADVTAYEPNESPKPMAYVRNCRIELCCGAGYHGVYEHCTVVSNMNPTAGNVLNSAQSLFGCVFAFNRGENCILDARDVVGCTFSDNMYLGGNIGKCITDDPNTAVRKFVNCIFHESVESTVSNRVKYAYNCIVPRENYLWSSSNKAKDPSFNDPEWKNITVERVTLDADFRPVDLGGKAVDAVTNEYAAYEALVMPGVDVTKDLTGGQRVYNGAQDIGAVEADWRARFARDIVSRNLSVSNASPATVENGDGKVEITEGDLTLVWRNRRDCDLSKATMNFQVKGNGTLTLVIDGETFKYAKADGPVTRTCTLVAKASKEIRFTYEPADGDSAGAVIGPFLCPVGMSVIIR